MELPKLIDNQCTFDYEGTQFTLVRDCDYDGEDGSIIRYDLYKCKYEVDVHELLGDEIWSLFNDGGYSSEDPYLVDDVPTDRLNGWLSVILRLLAAHPNQDQVIITESHWAYEPTNL